MSDLPQQPPVPGADNIIGAGHHGSPGAMLRQAREAAGLEIDTLAANLRVAAAKLQLLESDRHAELPDPAFARALALTVCRALHIDPAPVLAGLPQAQQGPRLEQVNQGLNQPFGPRRSLLGAAARVGGPRLQAPAAVLAIVLALAALVVYFWPQIQQLTSRADGAAAGQQRGEPVLLPDGSGGVSADDVAIPSDGSADKASANRGSADVRQAADALPDTEATAAAPVPVPQAAPDSASAALLPSPTAAMPTAPALQPATALASAPGGSSTRTAAPLLLRTTAPSWVDVRDDSGRSVLSRQLAPGESVSLDGAGPWRVKIGNAGGTEILLRGQRIDLAPHTRNNVARLELN